MPTDASSASEATRAEAAGETVLVSTRTVPGRAAETTLAATASSASSSASDVMTTSTWPTRSAEVPATAAPRAESAAAFSGVRL